MELAEVGCGEVCCNILGLYLSGDGVLSPFLPLGVILAEWTSVIYWWYRLNGLLSSLGERERGGEIPGLPGGVGVPRGLKGLSSGDFDQDVEYQVLNSCSSSLSMRSVFAKGLNSSREGLQSGDFDQACSFPVESALLLLPLLFRSSGLISSSLHLSR